MDTLQTMAAMEGGGFWDGYRRDWQGPDGQDNKSVWSLWSQDLVGDLSRVDSVEGIFALGTVLSISLRDAAGGGIPLVSPLLLLLLSVILIIDRIYVHGGPRSSTEALRGQRAFPGIGQCAIHYGQPHHEAGFTPGHGGFAAEKPYCVEIEIYISITIKHI